MKTASLVCALGVVLCSSTPPCLGALYYGNEYGAPGAAGAVSTGSLSLTDNGTTVFGTFNRGSGSFTHNLVFYLDTIRNSGYTGTAGLPGGGDSWQRAISGDGTVGRSTLNFAAGFGAEYAIVLSPNLQGGYLYRLVGGSTPSIERIVSVALNPNNEVNYASYTFRFSFADIGNPESDSFRFQSTYVQNSGSRTTQSFEQIASGSAGFGTITFAGFNVYGIEPIPEMANFALAIFGSVLIGSRLLTALRRRFRLLRSRAEPS